MGPLFAQRRRVASLASALAVLASAPAAHADPESDAKDLFARGREMRGGGNCAGAAPLFRKAWKIYPLGLGSARNLAECEEELGHYASARRAWLDIKRALITTKDEAKYAGWDREADEAAKRLQPKVATLFVDVIVKSPEGEAPASERSGVELLVNGESLGNNLVGTPLERDPGAYTVRAQAPRAQPVTQDVTLAAGDSRRITLRLEQAAAPRAAGAGARDGVATSPVDDTGSGKRLAGWILVGVGGAALVGSGITFLVRQSALGDLEDGCPNYETGACPAELKGTVDRGQTMSLLTNILLPVGVVAAGTGIGLLIWGSEPKQPTEVARAAGLRVIPGPGRVDAVWRF